MTRRAISGGSAILAALILIASLVAQLASTWFPSPKAGGLMQVINHLSLGAKIEAALIGLATIALIGVCIRVAGRPSAGYWWALAGTFALLFAVKVSGAFARFEGALRSLDGGAGWYGWQPSSVIMIVVLSVTGTALVAVFLNWVLTLQPAIKWQVMASGILFASGAVGGEALTEWLWSVYGPASVQYIVADFLETALECAGLIVFIDALVAQLRQVGPPASELSVR